MHQKSVIFPKVVPQLPKFAYWSIRLLPDRALQQSLQMGLNQVFKASLDQGDLAFLKGRQIVVKVTDIGLAFGLTLADGKLRVRLNPTQSDVTFTAKSLSLLQVVAGQTDPDTLFFRRQLSITGDTELGLAVKNFLDSLEPETLIPGPIHRALVQLAAHAP